MKDISDKNFGLIIASILPGFILLYGLSFSIPQISTWLLSNTPENTPKIAGFLYTSLASLALGMTTSAFRWLLIDHVMHLIGVKSPNIDFSKLSDRDKYSAFLGLVENHYRYYQYYSNTLVSILISSISYIIVKQELPQYYFVVLVIAILITLFFASRDALRKYYNRTKAILNEKQIITL
ncbi:hypothetical protein KKI24_11700 [bacterium]|nr:hypothetical protein [bacterium]